MSKPPLKTIIMKTVNELMEDYRIINLSNGDYVQVKYDVEGIVYDMFDKNDEHLESLGFDLYIEIRNIVENKY